MKSQTISRNCCSKLSERWTRATFDHSAYHGTMPHASLIPMRSVIDTEQVAGCVPQNSHIEKSCLFSVDESLSSTYAQTPHSALILPPSRFFLPDNSSGDSHETPPSDSHRSTRRFAIATKLDRINRSQSCRAEHNPSILGKCGPGKRSANQFFAGDQNASSEICHHDLQLRRSQPY